MRTFLKWSFIFVFGLVVFNALFSPPPGEQGVQQTAERQADVDPPAVLAVQDTDVLAAPPESSPEPPGSVVEAGWVAHDFEIDSEEDISSSVRARHRVWIVAPTALTPDDRVATMMVAAQQAWQTHGTQYVAVFLYPHRDAFAPLGRISFAPDGCGVSGSDCSGEMWTDAGVSDVVFTDEQLAAHIAWRDNRDMFMEPGEFGETLNEARLIAFMADEFGTTPAEIGERMVVYVPEDIEIPQRVKDRMAPSDQELEAACRFDLQCWGDEHSFRATVTCQPIVEGVARYAYEWTDGWLGAKFGRFRWLDREQAHVTYLGDSIRFQNAFGAWQNASYECDYDPDAERVLDVRVFTR